MKTLDSREASRLATRIGVRRLFMLQLDSEMKYLARELVGAEKMALQYKTIGSWQELKDGLLLAAVDRALFEDGREIRTKEAFVAKADDGYRRLSGGGQGTKQYRPRNPFQLSRSGRCCYRQNFHRCSPARSVIFATNFPDWCQNIFCRTCPPIVSCIYQDI